MKPTQKAIKKARKGVQKRQQLELDQKEFNMCLDERVCPKCAELLDLKSVVGGYNYTCTNQVCDYTHYREIKV